MSRAAIRTLVAAGRGVEVHVAETSEAVELYNRVATSEAVGGLFHSTC